MDCSLVEAKESLSTDSIELYLPDDWDPMLPDPVDCFKAFITNQTTSFNTLELPELVAGGTPAEYVSTRGNYGLEQLLGGSSVLSRHVRLVPVREDWWVTAEIKVCTISQGTSSHPMKMTLPEVTKKKHLL
jgi:hypothetical protein